MGDIIIAVSLALYVVACICLWRDNRHRRSQHLTEAAFAEIEQMIKGYKEKIK